MASKSRKGRKKFLGMIRNVANNKKFIVGVLVVAGIGAAYFMLSGRKTGISTFDPSLQSVGEYTHLYGAAPNIPLVGDVFGAVGIGAPMTSADAAPPKMTPTAAASEGGQDRFTSFSNAYYGRRRAYAGRKTNDITDRVTMS